MKAVSKLAKNKMKTTPIPFLFPSYRVSVFKIFTLYKSLKGFPGITHTNRGFKIFITDQKDV